MSNTERIDEICSYCGICCRILIAHVSEEEAGRMCREHGIAPGVFSEPGGSSLADTAAAARGRSHRIIMPCYFQQMVDGRSRCTVHEAYRPAVCTGYLCRVAIEYDQGLLPLEDARLLLRVSGTHHAGALFNWTGDPEESRLLQRVIISRLDGWAETVVKESEAFHGVSKEQLAGVMALEVSGAQDRYDFTSPLLPLVLTRLFEQARTGSLDLRTFFTEEELEDEHRNEYWKEAARSTMYHVIESLAEICERKGGTG